MFERSFHNAFICLRCQSRLLRKGSSKRFAVIQQRSTLSTVRPLFSPDNETKVEIAPIRYVVESNDVSTEDDKPTPRQEGLLEKLHGERGDELGDEPAPLLIDSLEEGTDGSTLRDTSFQNKGKKNGKAYPRHKRLMGKVRGKRGEEVREGSAPLSIDSLGAKAEVIILRDAGFQRKVEVEQDDYRDAAGQKQKLGVILKSIEDEKTGVNQDAINQSIDRLRPAVSGPSNFINAALSLHEYNTLCDTLTKCFTLEQLRKYCRMVGYQMFPDEERKGKKVKKEKKETASSIEKTNTTSVKSIGLFWSFWRPGVTHIRQRRSEMIPPISKKAFQDLQVMKSKPVVVSSIVRLIWNVDVAEEMDNEIGELEFKLPPPIWDLFNAGSPSRLMEIADKQKVKIENFPPKRIVRITADKSSAMHTLEIVDEMQSSVISKNFNDAELLRGQKVVDMRYRLKDLTAIANATKTAIVEFRRSHVTIYGTDLEQIHDAKRALIQLKMEPPKESVVLLTIEPSKSKAVLQEVAPLESLPYQARSKRYERFQCPVTRKSTTHSQDQIEAGPDKFTSKGHKVMPRPRPTTIMTRVIATLLSQQLAIETFLKIQPKTSANSPYFRNGSLEAVAASVSSPTEGTIADKDANNQTSEVPDLWSKNVEVRHSAVFGQVLKPMVSASETDMQTVTSLFKETRPSKPSRDTFNPEIPASSFDRNSVFHSVVPRFPHVIPHFPVAESTKDSEGSDILSFSLFYDNPPAPEASEVFANTRKTQREQTFPELRIEFKVSSFGVKPGFAEFSSMYAIIGRNSVHTRLPAHAVDVCFRSQAVVQLNPEAIESYSSVKNFIEMTKNNILGGGRLRAPHVLKIPIPAWLLESGPQLENKGPKDKSVKTAAVKTANLQYFFASVEYKQTIRMKYDEYPLLYTSVEAGKMGGRYGELSLQLPADHHSRTKKGAGHRSRIARKAFEIVGIIDHIVHDREGLPQFQAPAKLPPGKLMSEDNAVEREVLAAEEEYAMEGEKKVGAAAG